MKLAALCACLFISSAAFAQQQRPEPADILIERLKGQDKQILDMNGVLGTQIWSDITALSAMYEQRLSQAHENSETRWMGCISDEACLSWMRSYLPQKMGEAR